MGSFQPTQSAAMTGWLTSVQRDPRTLGAFRRRIEVLLSDPAVARRVARRLDCDIAERAAPPPRPVLQTGGCIAARGTIFGRCDCHGACRLMAPDLRQFPARAVPPVLVPSAQG